MRRQMRRQTAPMILTGLTLCALTLGYGTLPGLTEPVHRHDGTEATSTDGSFDALMARSMERMHADMAIPPSGNPDRDFAAMMIPHHQGAIEMAKAQLIHGRDPVLRRLAQGIIVEQSQEIEVMRRALINLALTAGATPSAPPAHPHHHDAAPTPAQGTTR